MRRSLWLALVLFFFTACTPMAETAVSPQPSSETAVVPTATVLPPVIVEEISTVAEVTAVPDPAQPLVEPTATAAVAAEPTAEEVGTETGVISGRTDDGAFFLGDPNAPITHIDYSDFL